MAHHARELACLGSAVRLVSGYGSSLDNSIETYVNPLFSSTHPEVLKLKRDLDAGQVPASLDDLVAQLREALTESLTDCDVCIAHNVLTLHKNLPLTAALAQFHRSHPIRLIAWCHDLAWTNPQYLPEMHDGYPWDLLRQPWPNVRYVTVSETRRCELAELLGFAPESIAVVVPGVNPARFFRWTSTTDMLVSRLHLLDADGILLIPARLTRRKNVALALKVLAALRSQSQRDFRLIVTGPPGPHNPANPGYLGELLALRTELALEGSAHFLYAFGQGNGPLIPDDDTVADLYKLADALFFPSLQEGFGIPVLEAGLAGLPIFCADIPPFRQTGQHDVYYFHPSNEPPEEIAARILQTLSANPTSRLRVRVRQSYRWDSLVREQLVPLLEKS